MLNKPCTYFAPTCMIYTSSCIVYIELLQLTGTVINDTASYTCSAKLGKRNDTQKKNFWVVETIPAASAWLRLHPPRQAMGWRCHKRYAFVNTRTREANMQKSYVSLENQIRVSGRLNNVDFPRSQSLVHLLYTPTWGLCVLIKTAIML